MELKYRLLDHPFYKSWSDGTVTREQLAKYAASYAEFIGKIPDYWKKVISEFVPRSLVGKIVINEERKHIQMWDNWYSHLEPAVDFPKMSEFLSNFEKMNSSQLLGALHAFEIQQPEVATTKKMGLLQYYGFQEKELVYFFDETQLSQIMNTRFL